MKFNVYRSEKRITESDVDVLVATTMHRMDADAVLKNWYRGFITNSKGVRIHEKNMG